VIRVFAVILFLAVPSIVPSQEAAGENPAASYAGQAVVGLWGELAKQDMYEARVALHDENARTVSGAWAGSTREDDLRQAFGGGLEISYGFFDQVKILLALEGRGGSAEGSWEGIGPNVLVDSKSGAILGAQRVARLSRYSVFGAEAGATVLLREYGWCRIGLTGRAGLFELAGAVERGREYGPIRNTWWNRDLSGTAPGILLGLEWEWLPLARVFSLPVGARVNLGYRWLQFNKVSYNYSDSTGLKSSGVMRDGVGNTLWLDFSGPEARVGLLLIVPTAVTAFEVKPE
jgi:hypothetical protein